MKTKPVTASTFWSKLWSMIGLLCLAFGIFFGFRTVSFYITSEPAAVKVVEVFSQQRDRKTFYRFAFQAMDHSGKTFEYTAKLHTTAELHKAGETTAGRVSARSGKVWSDAVLRMYKRLSLVLLLLGLYLSRHVTFGPIGYFLGRFVGFSMRLLRRVA